MAGDDAVRGLDQVIQDAQAWRIKRIVGDSLHELSLHARSITLNDGSKLTNPIPSQGRVR